MDVSPRIQEVFARTRKQLLPEIARQLYVEAKRALDRKDGQAADRGFAAVVELIDGADPETREDARRAAVPRRGIPRPERGGACAGLRPAAATAGAQSAAAPDSIIAPRSHPAGHAPVGARGQLEPAELHRRHPGEYLGRGPRRSGEIVRPSHPAYDRLLRALGHDLGVPAGQKRRRRGTLPSRLSKYNSSPNNKLQSILRRTHLSV